MRHRTITQEFLTPLSKIFERIMFVYNAHYNITCSVDIVIFVQLAISVKIKFYISITSHPFSRPAKI